MMLLSFREGPPPRGWFFVVSEAPGPRPDDRAYSNAKPEKFQLPARSLGYRVVFDYRINQLGIQESARGFIQVDGAWYCSSMPDILINATLDFRKGLISEEMCATRIEERRLYKALPKGKPDHEGYQQFMCPAAGNCPVARCENKPKSMRSPKPVPVRITLKPDVRANPPGACTQQSVMIAPEIGAKFAQDLHYGSPDWKAMYGMRNVVEGVNGYLKTGPTRRSPTRCGGGSSGWPHRACSAPFCSSRRTSG